MKITDIKTINYLPLKSGIIFRPISDECEPQDNSTDKNKVKYNINVFCYNDDCDYILTISQTKGAKKIFNLVKSSISNGFKPIELVVKQVGNKVHYYNNYDDSFILDVPSLAYPGGSSLYNAMIQDKSENNQPITEMIALELYRKITKAREISKSGFIEALEDSLQSVNLEWEHTRAWFQKTLNALPS